ncbi:MAG: hypothetical protein KF832_16340 [Caldilineaceae bacterium]|nr:hypothetical protein [Caldilineaceae bacterium]
MNAQHSLFQHFPLEGRTTISTGEVPTPYQIYDGYGAFLAGTADLAAVQRLLQPESVIPLQNRAGRALMGIWLCDFTEASLGAHHELQFSLFVSRQPLPPIAATPVSLLATMLTNPAVEMLCHGLWNNTPTVVAYNRELLSLNAQLAQSQIQRDTQQMRAEVRDATSGEPLLTATLTKPQQATLRANLALARHLGWRKTLAVGRQPWVQMSVVNPVGVGLPRNAAAQAMTKNATNTIRYFAPNQDHLTIHASRYQALEFQPQVVQHMSGFKFVYLNPTEPRSVARH